MPNMELTEAEVRMVELARMTPQQRAARAEAIAAAQRQLLLARETPGRKAQREALEAMTPEARRAWHLLREQDRIVRELAKPQLQQGLHEAAALGDAPRRN